MLTPVWVRMSMTTILRCNGYVKFSVVGPFPHPATTSTDFFPPSHLSFFFISHFSSLPPPHTHTTTMGDVTGIQVPEQVTSVTPKLLKHQTNPITA